MDQRYVSQPRVPYLPSQVPALLPFPPTNQVFQPPDLPSQVAAAFVVAPLRSLVGTVEEVVKRALQGIIETYKALKIAMRYLISPLEYLFNYFWKFARKLLPRSWQADKSVDDDDSSLDTDVEGWELDG
jgi:hypothetical protein